MIRRRFPESNIPLSPEALQLRILKSDFARSGQSFSWEKQGVGYRLREDGGGELGKDERREALRELQAAFGVMRKSIKATPRAVR